MRRERKVYSVTFLENGQPKTETFNVYCVLHDKGQLLLADDGIVRGWAAGQWLSIELIDVLQVDEPKPDTLDRTA